VLCVHAGTTCTPGDNLFALTGVSAPACLATEVGAMWSRFNAQITKSDCSYSLVPPKPNTGDVAYVYSYAWPSTTAKVSYPQRTGGNNSWTSIQ